MQTRADIIDENFCNRVLANDLPSTASNIGLDNCDLLTHELVDLFESQVMSRQLDLHSRRLQARGESFYTIGSAGHEGNVVCGKVFRHTDMAFLHYRSAAFLIQRSKQLAGQTPLYDMLLSFAASSDDPISGGRHKVLGSKSLFIPPQTSTIASHLPKAVGAAFSIPLSASNNVKVESDMPLDSVVICNFGDASSNHSTAQGAINSAAWAAYQGAPLPLVFICEDNGIGISTATPEGWIAANFSNRPGLNYLYCNGLDLLDTYKTMKKAETIARYRKEPVFVHMKTIRLMGHAGSDAEIAYRTQKEIDNTEAHDPLLYSAEIILKHKILSPQDIVSLYCSMGERIARVAEFAIKRPKLDSIKEVCKSISPKRPLQDRLKHFPEVDKRIVDKQMAKPQPMGRIINWTLRGLMASQQNIVLCGEDVGVKGGVYHVTHGLVERFGASRVINTLLDEQSILGLALGMAHNGFMPIPEIQFLAYVHNAEDQIRGEAATLSFFSNGQFSNPMVIRVAGLGYQKGFGGHFHNDNSLAVFRDIPGIVIACPSNGKDASAMLSRCVHHAWEQKRVVVFIEPIALYMTRDLHEEGDGLWAHCFDPEITGIEIGQFGIYLEQTPENQQKICIITYANGYFISRQAAKILNEKHCIDVTIIDLRWLSDIDEEALINAASPFDHILVVDECRKTGSVSEAILTLFVESEFTNKNIKRITGEDCFVPLGKAATLGMPSRDDIVRVSLSML